METPFYYLFHVLDLFISGGSYLRRILSPEDLISGGSYLRRILSPDGFISGGSYLRRILSPEDLISGGSYLRRTLSPDGFISGGSYLRRTLSPDGFISGEPQKSILRSHSDLDRPRSEIPHLAGTGGQNPGGRAGSPHHRVR